MRVLIVDDHVLFREGLSNLLIAWGQEVVGNAGDGDVALERTRALRPDLVLMDVHLPTVSGMEATRLIKAEFPAIRMIMISAFDNPAYESRSRDAGADAYLLKNMSVDQLRAALAAPGQP